jgi:single-strand DNA-binding protein
MANYNKVILVGNLTRDPQLSYLPSQTPVCEFGIAVNRRWRGANGEQREETCFVDCRLFGKQAETFNQYMSKGRPVLIEGRLQLDTWEGQDGQRRSKHRIFVQNFQFLGSARDAGQAARAAPPVPQPASEPQPQPPQDAPPPEPEPPIDEPAGDNIPF